MPLTPQLSGRQLAGGGSSQVWARLVGRCGAALAQLLFPAGCHLCRRDLRDAPGGLLLCGECREQLAAGVPVCGRCAMPLPAGMASEGQGCPHCRTQRLRFDRAAAIGFYAGAMREAVLRVKQARQEPLALALGRWLGERLAADDAGAPPDLVAAVPMHVSRRLVRGINPAAVAAEAVAGVVGVAALPGLLSCRRKTKKQGMLPPGERRRNVRGAYRVAKGYDINGARVLLVDDVMTTGATANEVSRMLRQAGAKEVSVAVIARGTGC